MGKNLSRELPCGVLDLSFFHEEYGDSREPVDEDFLPDEYAIDAEKRQIVMDIVKKTLSEKQYQTVIMFYFDEMNISDIAKAMGVPEGTIKSRLNVLNDPPKMVHRSTQCG